MKESGMNAEIQRMEVVLRGLGSGREAVTKALLGSEGRFLRSKVVKVADATRLKFGGTRSRKPRRLG
jgi:small subunit ribosomal protein S11